MKRPLALAVVLLLAMGTAAADNRNYDPDAHLTEDMEACRKDKECNKMLTDMQRKRAAEISADAAETDTDRAMEVFGFVFLCFVVWLAWRLLLRSNPSSPPHDPPQ